MKWFLSVVLVFVSSAAMTKTKEMKKASATKEARGVAADPGAAPTFSAFAVDGVLYVTMMSDGCSSPGAELVVDPSCSINREATHPVSDCTAELEMMVSHAMACRNPKVVPYVISIDLKSKLDGGVRRLHLRRGFEQIDVNI